MSFAIVFCNASRSINRSDEQQFDKLKDQLKGIQNFTPQSLFHLYGKYDFCVIGKIDGANSNDVSNKIKTILSEDESILHFQCDRDYVKLPKNKLQFLLLVEFKADVEICRIIKSIKDISKNDRFNLSFATTGQTLLIFFRVKFNRYYHINEFTNKIDNAIYNTSATYKTTLIVAKDYMVDDNRIKYNLSGFIAKIRTIAIIKTIVGAFVNNRLSNHNNNDYTIQKFNQYFNINSFKKDNQNFNTLGYIHIVNALTQEGIKFFKDISLSIDYIRKDIVINSTPRRMDVSGGKKLSEKKELIEIYRNMSLISILRELTNEKNIGFCLDDIEWAISTKLSRIRDTHGWHKDDYPIALIIVVEQPKREFGGVVKLKNKNKVVDLKLNTGDCYILRSDRILHKVTELNTNKQKRIIFNFTYSIKDSKNITSGTAKVLCE